MIEVCKGDIVRSLNGRDQGKPLFVLEVDGAYLVLVDGKSRKMEHPKRKKEKHCVFFTRREECRVSEKLRAGEKVSNSEIRRAIATFVADGNVDQIGGG